MTDVCSDPEYRALLAAVRAQPDEDNVRLVYADWLDEHGQPERAEFIRVQVELARCGPEPRRHAKSCPRHGLYRIKHQTPFTNAVTCPKCRPKWLRQREEELFALDRAQGWNGFLLDGAMRHIVEFRMEEEPGWRRGFIEDLHAGADGCDMSRVLQLLENPSVVLCSLTCPAADWIQHAAAVLAEHPVRRVRLTTVPRAPGGMFVTTDAFGAPWPNITFEYRGFSVYEFPASTT